MNNDLPFFKFRPVQYMTGDIQTCSLAAQGLFVNLLCKLWQKGGYLPDDDKAIARLLRIEPEACSNALAELKECQIVCPTLDGHVFVEFIIEEIATLSEAHKKRAEAGRKGGHAKALSNPSIAKALPEQSKSDALVSKKSDTDTDTETDVVLEGADDSYPCGQETYEKHPALKILHECPNLRAITLETFLALKRSRSEYMDIEAAATEAARRAELELRIDRPGRFVDSVFGYWEKDHIDAIRRTKGRADRAAKEFEELVSFIVEVGGPDVTGAKRQLEDFTANRPKYRARVLAEVARKMELEAAE